MLRTLSLSALLYGPLTSGSLRPQELKCGSVKPLPGSSSACKNRGHRCAGLCVADVGSNGIDVLFFTSGIIRYDLNSKSLLKISAPGSSPFVNICGVAITPKTYYRMDTFLQPAKSLAWPVTDVLLPEGLTDNRIGIFGWAGAESAKKFVPFDVRSGIAAPGNDHVMLLAQTSLDGDAIKWRWASIQGRVCLAFGGWEDAISHPITANSSWKSGGWLGKHMSKPLRKKVN